VLRFSQLSEFALESYTFLKEAGHLRVNQQTEDILFEFHKNHFKIKLDFSMCSISLITNKFLANFLIIFKLFQPT